MSLRLSLYGFISDGDVYFYITDYQGNVREVTDIDGEVVQDAHYYPYGMLMAESSDILDVNRSGLTSLSVLNPYLFGCKEYIPFKGANSLDFTARYYDPATTIFGTPDPLEHNTPSLHARMYCAANPINFIDPTGMEFYYADNVEGIKAIMEFIKEMIEKSSSFAYVYNKLENSDIRYTVTKGVVNENDANATARFDPTSNTLVFTNNSDVDIKEFIVSEEMYHIFQQEDSDENGNKFNTPDVNIEFEAKTFALFVKGEIFDNIGGGGSLLVWIATINDLYLSDSHPFNIDTPNFKEAYSTK